MGICHWEQNVSSVAILFKFAVRIIIRIRYVLLLGFVIIIIISVVFVIVVTTGVFGHILATFAGVRTATAVCAVHFCLAALAALCGAPFLDTSALHEMNDGIRSRGSVVMMGIHTLSSSFHSHPKCVGDGKAGLESCHYSILVNN